MEAQKERQERIFHDLEKPLQNKIKLSNIHVLGLAAIQDPTQIEKEVRKQMAQRLKNHQMRNEARKLTPQERKLKKKKKLSEDTSLETRVAVFRLEFFFHICLNFIFFMIHNICTGNLTKVFSLIFFDEK
jgi:U4/U6 small nuclear ribonucleoprotein PRP3